MPQQYDNTVKYIIFEHADEFARFVLGDLNVKVLENLETEQATLKAHRTDCTMRVQFPDEIAIFHTEVQTHTSGKPIGMRLAGYNGFLTHAHEMNVYSNVLYLHPRAGRNDTGLYEYGRGTDYEFKLRYKVIRLADFEGEAILEMQAPGLLPFTPLMKPPARMQPDRWLEKCFDAIATSRADEGTQHLLFEAAGVLGGLAHDPHRIRHFLPEGIMLESAFVQLYMEEARDEGRAEGRAEGRNEGRNEGGIKALTDAILALLGTQFHPEAVQTLQPKLAEIKDLQRLQQLHLAAARSESLEAFMQHLGK